jgi:O-antigen ligase
MLLTRARVLRADLLLLYGAAVFGSIALGIATAGGGVPVAAAVVICLGLPLILLFISMGERTLGIWLAITAVAYPFLRYPATRSIVTFDRVWIMTMAAVAIMLWPRPQHSPATRRLLKALVVFTVAVGVRAALTTGAVAPPPVEIWIDAFVLPTALFVVASRTAITRRGVWRILSGMTVAGTTLAVIGISERLFGFELATRSGGAVRLDVSLGLVRISGPYGAPEVFALSLILCLAATAVWTYVKARRFYFVGVVLLTLQGIAIALTLFRAAWIGGLVVLVGFAALRRGHRLRFTVIVGLTFIILYASASYAETASTTFAVRLNNTNNIVGRVASYEEGISIWKTAPVFGVGINKYTPATQNVARAVVGGVTSVRAPHNSFIDVLAEQGIVGLALLMGVVVAVVRLLHALSRRARTRYDELLSLTLILASLAYLVMALTLTVLPYGPGNAFYAVLLGVGAGRLDALVRSEYGVVSARVADIERQRPVLSLRGRLERRK